MSIAIPNTTGGAKKSGWVGLLALFTVASVIEAAFWNQLNVFTPLYLPRLGIAADDVKGWVGTIGALSSLLGLPFLPFWGALADRYARQPIIVRSFVAHLLAGIVSLLAGNVWVFLLARAIGSLALGNSGLMMTTLSERTPQGRVSFAFAVMSGGSPLGAFIGPLLGGPIVDAYGFRTLLGIDVVVMAFVVLAMTFGYRDSFRGRQRGPLLRMAGDSLVVIWRSRRLRALFPALFLLFAGWMLSFAYITLAVKQIYKGTDLATATGIVVGVGGLMTLVLSPLLGLLADKVGQWPVLFAFSAIEVLLWPLPLLTQDIVPFTLAWGAISGVSSAVFAISFSVLSSSTVPEVRGRVMSFAYLPVNVGFILGASLGAVVTQSALFPTLPALFNIFPVSAALTLLGIFALWFAYRQPVE